MVKYTQTIPWQQPTNFLSVFYHFVGLMLKGLRQNLANESLTFFQVTPRVRPTNEQYW